MLSEIGSTFWLDPSLNYRNIAESVWMHRIRPYNDAVFLSSGRAAECMVLKTIEQRNPKINKVAIIPAFTCTTVIKPFKQYGYRIFTYNIDERLQANINEIRDLLINSNANVVLFHRYYGFDTCEDWSELIQEFSLKGIVFIEDKTQCIYSSFKKLNADYVIGSIRKWGPLPDGGFALCKVGYFQNKPITHDKKMVDLRLQASYLKYDYIYNKKGDKSVFRQLYEDSAELLYEEDKFFSMSPISRAIQENIDIDHLKFRRRENYDILYNGLIEKTEISILTPALKGGDVPLYFPFLVQYREKLQKKLALQNIYAPMIWPYEDRSLIVDDKVMNIYDNVLCIPVDQRYEKDDMLRVLEQF